MLTRDQALNCIFRVRRIEELKRQADTSEEKPPDYPLLVLMLRHLKQRERMLMAQLSPEERVEIREEIERLDAQMAAAQTSGQNNPKDH